MTDKWLIFSLSLFSRPFFFIVHCGPICALVVPDPPEFLPTIHSLGPTLPQKKGSSYRLIILYFFFLCCCLMGFLATIRSHCTVGAVDRSRCPRARHVTTLLVWALVGGERADRRRHVRRGVDTWHWTRHRSILGGVGLLGLFFDVAFHLLYIFLYI